jgi:hypothetical protein
VGETLGAAVWLEIAPFCFFVLLIERMIIRFSLRSFMVRKSFSS